MTGKICTKCAVFKTFDNFGKQSSTKDGLKYYCKPCEVARVRAHKVAHPEQEVAWRKKNAATDVRSLMPADATRECVVCFETKLLREFGKCSGRVDNIDTSCKDCVSARSLEYYQKNPEMMRQKTAVWRENNPEKAAELITRYRAENSERIKETTKEWRERNTEYLQARERIRLHTHRAEIYAKNAKRRAVRLKATPSWISRDQLMEIEALYEEAIRLTAETGIVHHVDHIIPLQGGTVTGLHVPWNLQILSAKKNLEKKNKLPPPSEWLAFYKVA